MVVIELGWWPATEGRGLAAVPCRNCSFTDLEVAQPSWERDCTGTVPLHQTRAE